MSELAITGLQVTCPVGLDAPRACAAIRAGVSRLAEHDGYFCAPPEGPAAEAAEGPEPVVAARVPGVPEDASGVERLLALSLLALQGLADEGLRRADVQRTALLVALPAPDGAVARWRLGATFARALCERSGVRDWLAVQCIEAGPAGTLRALETARAALDAGRADRCVVLAVDSLVSNDRLSSLDEGWRLRSTRNPDGLLPGEASAAIVLEPRRAAERRKATLAGILGGVAWAEEPVTIASERWSTAGGLCGALRPLLEGPDGAVGRYVLCDLNGEAYRAHEWGLAQVRLRRELPSPERLVHPAQAIGDAGAATPAVLIACACQAFTHGYAPAPAALIWAASDGGGRAAAVVRPASHRM